MENIQENSCKGISIDKRVKEIYKITKFYEKQGVKITYIYKTYIYPQYGIAISSYFNYLRKARKADNQ